ncbi:MAG: FAD-dependent oxidoreductase [Planctomycetota bacterium]
MKSPRRRMQTRRPVGAFEILSRAFGQLSLAILFPFVIGGTTLRAESHLIEAESFQDHGGWKLDTQFIQQMGSPYLLAHGLGQPVDDAKTAVNINQAGPFRVWVRTLDWVGRWNGSPSPSEAPGRFQVIVDGEPLADAFGDRHPQWHWQDGGVIKLVAGSHLLAVHDLTGFDGRFDCIFLTDDLDSSPPPVDDVLAPWRRSQLGLPDEPVVKGPYDLVVIGGGYAGMGSAISAARMGCRVALVQDRGVLGGNGSSEVRVWAKGNIRRGKFPRIGEMIEEFADQATKSPGRKDEFGDELKEQVVRAEPNIDLLLNHHAYAVNHSEEGNQIESVRVMNTQTGEDLMILGDLFADCTGHGWIGHWAKADLKTTPDGRMGMSNMWRWDDTDAPKQFPPTPWALDLTMDDFPYPRDHHGQWFWESGFDQNPIDDAEAIRDWNLRAVYGAFNAMKNRDGAADHANAVLSWVAYIGGPRESRRLLGDVVLTQDDVINKRDFDDGIVPSTWSIDLHYPKQQYAQKYPENPFISVAVHDRRVDRSYGYPVPYRCFYSRNVDNLFMAGRCISVTHEALGTVRVMKTCGMMGEVVGKAASICASENCLPRDVYDRHLDELLRLCRLPGKARRSTPSGDMVIPDDAMEMASAYGPIPGMKTKDLPGITMDDSQATFTGTWKSGSGLKAFVGREYRYTSARPSPAQMPPTATFEVTIPKSGRYTLRIYSQPHANRAIATPLDIQIGSVTHARRINQRQPGNPTHIDLGPFEATAGQTARVTFSTADAGGTVHVDAVGWIRND